MPLTLWKQDKQTSISMLLTKQNMVRLCWPLYPQAKAKFWTKRCFLKSDLYYRHRIYPRTDYSNIEIDSLSYNNIVNYLKDLSDSSGMSIHYPKLEQIQIVNNTIDKLKQAESHFFNRAFCSGLFSSLYILPDGQVTMCEQLYWNKRFIIWNVKSNSILEIWNSKEAKSLYEIKQEDFPEDSLCHSCGKFKECRTFRQVCYRDIIRKYCSQKWYYPDVKCPYNNQK